MKVKKEIPSWVHELTEVLEQYEASVMRYVENNNQISYVSCGSFEVISQVSMHLQNIVAMTLSLLYPLLVSEIINITSIPFDEANKRVIEAINQNIDRIVRDIADGYSTKIKVDEVN